MGNDSIYIPPSSNAVSSVFGRTGTVVAAANDYTFAQLANKPTTISGYGITDAINVSAEGTNNGVATLDGTGKVPLAQLPTIGTQYKGLWNATTNTPTLANGSGTAGDFYFANVSGSTNFGAGSITFAVGDIAIYNGTIWQKNPTGGVQVNSDWSSSTGVSQILNKPTTFTSLGVQIATGSLLGRTTAGTGVPEVINVGTGLSLTSGTLTATASAVTVDNIGAATVNTITYGASVTYNGNNGTYQKLTLTGNSSITLSNIKIGVWYHFEVIQDTTGNRTISFVTPVTVAFNGLGSIPISINANAVDIYHILYNGSTYKVEYALRFS